MRGTCARKKTSNADAHDRVNIEVINDFVEGGEAESPSRSPVVVLVILLMPQDSSFTEART